MLCVLELSSGIIQMNCQNGTSGNCFVCVGVPLHSCFVCCTIVIAFRFLLLNFVTDSIPVMEYNVSLVHLHIGMMYT